MIFSPFVLGVFYLSALFYSQAGKILIGINWCHSIQTTFYHSFAIKLFSFAGLPGRKNNLPALDDRRARKSLSPETDAEDLNSFKSSS
jgi:hypothetical protein